jgi:hypothetical protein
MLSTEDREVIRLKRYIDTNNWKRFWALATIDPKLPNYFMLSTEDREVIRLKRYIDTNNR